LDPANVLGNAGLIESQMLAVFEYDEDFQRCPMALVFSDFDRPLAEELIKYNYRK
jgi:hypothetical protein